jgi:erythromycin esterase
MKATGLSQSREVIMRVVALLGLLLLRLIPATATACLFAQESSVSPTAADTAVVRAWIRDHAIGLTTVEAGNGLSDLQPLRQIVGDARIVALGEAGHGTREFFRLKHRLLEFLVSEMDFNVFAIEATFPEALDVNRYVLSGEGDPVRALAGLHFWIRDTEEVLALIRWMREYNLNETKGRKVKFHGFDQQFRARAARTVLDYLRRVDPAAGRAASRILEPLADPTPFPSAENEGTPEDVRGEVADALLRMAGDFDERLDSYAAMTSVEEAKLVRQHLEILLQNVGAGGLSRDAAMAKNVAWILDREGPDSKAVLWAHNQHVAVREGSQGEDLRRRYGDDYRVVGFTFGHGGIQARDVLRDGEVLPWFVESAPDTTLEAQLSAAAPEIALIDLRSLPETGPVTSWFKSPQTMRSLGHAYTYEYPEWFWWTAPVAEVYDALVFVEETTPARANLTGRVPGLDLPTAPANLDFELGLPGGWPLGWTMPRGGPCSSGTYV